VALERDSLPKHSAVQMNRGFTGIERCAFAICLALTVCSVSATVNGRSMYRHEVIAAQQAILSREPF
jgi:hypothetical protein